jgi:hypothetical protein
MFNHTVAFSVLVSAIVAPFSSAQPVDGKKAALQFIADEHDVPSRDFEIHRDRDSGHERFYPSNLMAPDGMHQKLILDTNCWDDPKRPIRTKPLSGTTCLQFTLPRGVPWGGAYLEYPDRNWTFLKPENIPGYDLEKYKFKGERIRVIFSAKGKEGGEVVAFFAGGMKVPLDSFGPVRPKVNANPKNGLLTLPTVTVNDNGKKINVPATTLAATWEEVVIDITDEKLDDVHSGLGWATNTTWNPGGCTFFLDNMRIEFGEKGRAKRLTEPRFVRSHAPQTAGKPDMYFRNACYSYDNSLIVMALCAERGSESLIRAKLICDAFLKVQEHDATPDGRVRNAYAVGELLIPTKQGVRPRFSGWWDDTKPKPEWIQDSYGYGVNCGNMAWTALALLTYWEADNGPKKKDYLTGALRICEFIEKHFKDKNGKGYYLGFVENEGDTLDDKKSTEHNIDLYVTFARLAKATGNPHWNTSATSAKEFVMSMIADDGHLWTGTKNIKDEPERDLMPLDVNPWALLAFKDIAKFERAVNWADSKCFVDLPNLKGYDFNIDKDGVWWEGTGQMSLAFRFLGNRKKADDTLDYIRKWGHSAQHPNGIEGASMDGLTTGFKLADGKTPWLYYKRAHTGGATCWYVFAEQHWNPYWNEKVVAANP